MEIKNFRVNNWYNWRGGDSPDEGYEQQFNIDDWSEFKKYPSRFRGILISKEWLKKLGFQKIEGLESWFIAFQGRWHYVYKDGGKWWYFFEKNGTEIRVNQVGKSFVHEIQNLFFELTGKEI